MFLGFVLGIVLGLFIRSSYFSFVIERARKLLDILSTLKRRGILYKSNFGTKQNTYFKERMLTQEEFENRLEHNLKGDTYVCLPHGDTQKITGTLEEKKAKVIKLFKEESERLDEKTSASSYDAKIHKISSQQHIPLIVSKEKGATLQGAVWSEALKTWFWPKNKWSLQVNEFLPKIHRERGAGPILVPDLIPKSLWYKNLRYFLSKEQWGILRKQTYELQGYRCLVCGFRGPDWPVECDEKWEYEETVHDDLGIVHFAGLQALCPSCHKVKHFGKANVDGFGQETREWMCFINNWSEATAEANIERIFEVWKDRSEMDWYMRFEKLKELYSIEIENCWSSSIDPKQLHDRYKNLASQHVT